MVNNPGEHKKCEQKKMLNFFGWFSFMFCRFYRVITCVSGPAVKMWSLRFYRGKMLFVYTEWLVVLVQPSPLGFLKKNKHQWVRKINGLLGGSFIYIYYRSPWSSSAYLPASMSVTEKPLWIVSWFYFFQRPSIKYVTTDVVVNSQMWKTFKNLKSIVVSEESEPDPI